MDYSREYATMQKVLKAARSGAAVRFTAEGRKLCRDLYAAREAAYLDRLTATVSEALGGGADASIVA